MEYCLCSEKLRPVCGINFASLRYGAFVRNACTCAGRFPEFSRKFWRGMVVGGGGSWAEVPFSPPQTHPFRLPSVPARAGPRIPPTAAYSLPPGANAYPNIKTNTSKHTLGLVSQHIIHIPNVSDRFMRFLTVSIIYIGIHTYIQSTKVNLNLSYLIIFLIKFEGFHLLKNISLHFWKINTFYFFAVVFFHKEKNTFPPYTIF